LDPVRNDWVLPLLRALKTVVHLPLAIFHLVISIDPPDTCQMIYDQ